MIYTVEISHKGQPVTVRSFRDSFDATLCVMRQEAFGYQTLLYTETDEEYAARLLREHGIPQVDDSNGR